MRLKSGREVYANGDIFSVDDDLKAVSYGYDGYVPWPSNDYCEPDKRLTASDMCEIADIMIDRWTRFRANL